MIEARGLTKRFGDKLAVDQLTFTVEPGRITGFLGPNGAGKTTTMRMILGLDRPTYLAEGLPGLLGPHPGVTVTGAAAACGGWRAAVHGGQVTLTGSGAAIDGLRALCAAAWSAGGVTEEAAAHALAGLDLPHPPG